MKSKEEVLNELYAAYGTDSGILFGIKERAVVEAIVDFTLNHSGLFALRAERDEYRAVLAAIYACDGMPGFDAAETANKIISKYNHD